MSEKFTSLEETAERFYKSPEFIWNLSLQFSAHLRPELGENGLIAYSEAHRVTVGRILKMRERGMSESEITQAINEPDQKQQPQSQKPATEISGCADADSCEKRFSLLSSQIKFMWKQLRQLQNENAALRARSEAFTENIASHAVEHICPAA